jgi:hypothetical protein
LAPAESYGRHGKLEKLEWKNWNGERSAALSGVVSSAGRLARRPNGRLRAGGHGYTVGETLIDTLKSLAY